MTSRIVTYLLIGLMALLSSSVQAGMTGAYGPMPDLNDENVIKAANFAVTQLYSSAESDSRLGAPRPPYSFLQVGVLQADQRQVEVVEGSQQVVAGMNYRITIALSNQDACVGAFRVIIYDRFGDLSITNWGQEVSCDLVMELQQANKVDGSDDSQEDTSVEEEDEGSE